MDVINSASIGAINYIVRDESLKKLTTNVKNRDMLKLKQEKETCNGSNIKQTFLAKRLRVKMTTSSPLLTSSLFSLS